jgi:pilus assembly protein Flp/PilA
MLSLYTNLSARLRRDEKGATAVEYGIMVALIAVVIIVAVTLLGGTLQDMFGDVNCKMTDPTKPNFDPALNAGKGGCAA